VIERSRRDPLSGFDELDRPEFFGGGETTMLKRFLQDEQGQDLIEYTLLLAFVCLATSALFVSSGGSLSGIWNSANSDLTIANASAAGS
jgi:Flp pilus assembly pilin Flp